MIETKRKYIKQKQYKKYDLKIYDHSEQINSYKNFWRAFLSNEIKHYLYAKTIKTMQKEKLSLTKLVFSEEYKDFFEIICSFADYNPEFIRKIIRNLLNDREYIKGLKKEIKNNSNKKEIGVLMIG